MAPRLERINDKRLAVLDPNPPCSMLLFFKQHLLQRCQKLTYLLIILGFGSVLINGCSHDGEGRNSSNPTPCGPAQAEQYAFTIQNNINNNFFECDTIFPSVVRFTASQVYSSAKWKIGTDPRSFTKTSFDLTFPSTSTGSVVIQCIGTRPINTVCIPHDDGIDTLTKVLTIMPLDEFAPHAAIEGKFLGSTTDAVSDTFVVRIFVGPDLLHPPHPAIFLYNLNKGCPGTSIDISAGYQGLVFNQGIGNTVCHGVFGTGHIDLKNRNKIRFDYDEQKTPGSVTLVHKTFLGTRIR